MDNNNTHTQFSEVDMDGAFEVGEVVTPNEVTGTLKIGQWYTVSAVYPAPVGEGEWYDLTATVDGDLCSWKGIPGEYLTGGSR